MIGRPLWHHKAVTNLAVSTNLTATNIHHKSQQSFACRLQLSFISSSSGQDRHARMWCRNAFTFSLSCIVICFLLIKNNLIWILSLLDDMSSSSAVFEVGYLVILITLKWFKCSSITNLPYILAYRSHHRIGRTISFVLKKLNLALTRT